MNTPIWQAVSDCLKTGHARFYLPGHKGAPLPGLGDIARFDLTEISGLDSLFEAEGCIAACEARFAALYGTAASLLSTGGSTLCIQAMLALALPPGSKVLAARGIHTAAVHAMALLDLHPVWLYPKQDPATGLAEAICAEDVRLALQQHPDIKAVYLTSPTYFGILSDISAISSVCREFSLPLLVDNAHGAHLRFLSPSLHPITLGADLCCDSLHKTLPVLTGGALLHISNPHYIDRARERMALFGSTSPSYLIMLSADGALPILEDAFPDLLADLVKRIALFSAQAEQAGFLIPGGQTDPVRLTLGFGGLGYTAAQFSSLLNDCGIEPELLDGQFCVLMASPFNTEHDFVRLESLLEKARLVGDPLPPYAFPQPPEASFSPRQAVFAECEEIPVDLALGRVSAEILTPCPPGIPLIIPGERLRADCIDALKNCGIFHLNVVK